MDDINGYDIRMGQRWSDEQDTDDGDGMPARRATRCSRCGARDVRWRQQGGQWVLFSLQPGVEHHCPVRSLDAIEDPDA